MGPCTSAEDAGSPSENWGAEPTDLQMEEGRARVGGDGNAIDVDAANDARPDDDGECFEFEADEVREGE